MRDRIGKLREAIEEHNYNYYVLSSPTISDFEYDQLVKALERIEGPSKTVGSDLRSSYKSQRP